MSWHTFLGWFGISSDNVVNLAKTALLILMGYGGVESYVTWATIGFILFGFWLILVTHDLEKDRRNELRNLVDTSHGRKESD
ncbi:hypothetical protein ABID59_003333 [Bradyrhizobium sp. S3.3.6]